MELAREGFRIKGMLAAQLNATSSPGSKLAD